MSKRKLLLADDSVTIQKVVNLTFADEDIEIITADNGDTAMHKFIEYSPDLVMIDVNLPDLSGFDICEMIKQDKSTRHIPVVLLVGAFETFDEEKARQVGANDFLTKPFSSIRQLVETVTDLFEGKNTGDKLSVPSKKPVVSVKTPQVVFESETEESYDTANASTKNLGTFVGADDQMIQTFPNADLIEPVVSKFESHPITEGHPVYESFTQTKNENFYDEPVEDKIIINPAVRFSEEEIKQSNNAVEGGISEVGFHSENKDLPQNSDSDTSAEALENKDQRYLSETTRFAKNSENFPPEMIEAIAEKITEKFSKKLIKEIVRETIAQMERKK